MAMTPDEYIRIDTEVAEKVMGLVPCAEWTPTNFGSAGGPAVTKRCKHPDGACYPTIENPGIFGIAGGCPRYSTKVAAAWEVVEKMTSTHYTFALSVFWKNRHPAEAMFGSEWGWDVTLSAETVPLAICRAALAAVGH
jgi:hypothetical protein